MKLFSGQSATGTITSTVYQEATCDLTMDQAPVVNGLILRMTPEEVLALFPGSKEDAEVRASLSRPPDQFGESGFIIRPAKFESKVQFPGINQIIFALLDRRVSTFSVGYNGPQWSHVDKFIAKFTAGTSLPAADAWEPYVGLDNSLKILKCRDFEIRVFAGGKGGSLNYLKIHDLDAEKKLKDRMDKVEQKATSENNPPG
jgi:hypothetical protein